MHKMKKHLRILLTTVLSASMMISSSFALPILTPSEVTMDITVEDKWTVFADSRYNYTNAHINQINNGASLGQIGVYTLDMTAVDASGKAEVPIDMGWNGDYYTTFPNPYPDGDDDDENGFDEEFEIAFKEGYKQEKHMYLL